MAKKKSRSGAEMPQGLSQMMAQNPEKLAAFNHMSTPEQNAVIARAHDAHSRAEMEEIVSQIGEGHQTF